MKTIFIYENNSSLSKRLQAVLEDDYQVVVYPQKIKSPDLVILNARVKWNSCRAKLEMWQANHIPVLFVTENTSMLLHLHSLYSAKSDVLLMPFTNETLRDKVGALLEIPSQEVHLSMDELQKTVSLNGREVALTAQEFALLSVLMEDGDSPVSRETLLRKAWGYQSLGETRTVDVHIQRLRKKLGAHLIETVYRYGYRLCLA